MPQSDPATQRLRDLDNQRRIMTMVRYLLYLIFVVIGFAILKRIAPILTPVLVAAVIAYLLDPWVDALERRGMRRGTAVAILLCGFITLLVLAVAAMIPLVTAEIGDFIEELPALVLRGEAWAQAEFGLELPDEWREYLVSGEMGALLEKAAMPAFDLAAAIVGGLMSVLGLLAELLLIPLFAFYFSVSWDRMLVRIRRFIPQRHRAQVGEIATEIDDVVSSWLRGALTVTAILAVLYAVAFKIIGLHLAIPLGLIVGFLTIVPFLGTLVGAALTAVIIVIDWQGPRQLIYTGGVFVVLHVLEAGVLTPKIVGHRVGLGEVGALFAVVAGGQLLGLTGVILAVPLAAAVMVVVRRVIRYYEKTGFYTDGALTAFTTGAEAVIADETRRSELAQAERAHEAEVLDAAGRAAHAWAEPPAAPAAPGEASEDSGEGEPPEGRKR